MKHYHFIGIGGIGMGTIASLLVDKGELVSGSDVKHSVMTQNLISRGVKIAIGHAAKNIDGADTVVYSSAVTADNPEMDAARKRGVPVLQRAQLLARLMENQTAVTIAGAHGKTTTTSMVSSMLMAAGLDPTTAVGGVIRGSSYGAHLGGGKYFVAEVDESDGSFLNFSPKYSIITNMDFEHVDYYHSWENIVRAYAKFMERTDPQGLLIVCGEDKRLTELAAESGRRFMTYGFSPEFDVYAANLRDQGCTSKFDCYYHGKLLGTFQLVVPGRHNVLNAMACICVGLVFQVEGGVLAESLLAFQGVNRRFQIKGRVNDIMVVDDYGHHPTEIAATLQAARSLKKHQIITVFQPHRYTRTKFLMDEFVQVFADTEPLLITDIYAASEPPIDGVSAAAMCERLRAGGNARVEYVAKEQIVARLSELAHPGDMVLTLGAGDITKFGDEFLTALSQRQSAALARVPEEELGTIGVIMGGCSSEKAISLKSGRAIVKALAEAGCRVAEIELDSNDPAAVRKILQDARIDVAFIALHGAFGEDGQIQEILESLNILYTGSDARASRVTINKVSTQQALKERGILVPAHRVLKTEEECNTAEVLKDLGGLPVVVKPACEGSSIGISIVRDEEKLREAVKLAFNYGPQVLIEQHIAGRELTAGILGGEALPLVEIKSSHSFFDYEAKYQKGLTEYIVPADVSKAARENIQAAALKAFQVIGCRDIARIDFILDQKGDAYVLEINTIPGFTETSLLPKAARQNGVGFPELCVRIVKMALARRSKSPCAQNNCCSGV